MSFLFPRTIKITRAAHQDGQGAVGYGGMNPAQTTTVAEAVPASVQAKNGGRVNPTALPGDTMPAQWRILVPSGLLAEGDVKDRDFIEDDLGRRFQVTADYFHPMGASFTCDRLET